MRWELEPGQSSGSGAVEELQLRVSLGSSRKGRKRDGEQRWRVDPGVTGDASRGLGGSVPVWENDGDTMEACKLVTEINGGDTPKCFSETGRQKAGVRPDDSMTGT